MFSWKAKPASAKNPKEVTKERLIRELTTTFPSIRRPNNDDTAFEIKFLVEDQYSVLKIYIPSDFPQTRPGNVLHYSSAPLSKGLKLIIH